MPILTDILYFVLIAVPTLTILILVHEIGHFWAARWMKVRIEEFGIGFPPRALTLGVKNGVRYSLNWILVGGFVRMAGEEDPKVEGSLAGKKPWQRLIVLSAGAIMNLVLAFLLFTGLAMYGRTEVLSRQVGIFWVEPGSPADQAGLLPGDIIVAINGRKVTTTDDLRLETTLNRGYTVSLVLEREGQQRTTSLIPRRDPPPGRGAMGIAMSYYEAPLTIRWLEEEGPAAQAGLRIGDTITAIDGRPIRDSLDFMAYFMDIQDEAGFVNLVQAFRQGGLEAVQALLVRPVTLSVEREGQPLPPVTLPLDLTDPIPLGLDYVRTTWHRYPLGYGLAEGWRETLDATLLVPRTLGAIFRGSVGVSDLSGPVGIVYIAGRVAQLGGWYSLLRLMAIVSVNLFLVNLFPIPAFDGGRLIFVLLEWIRRGRRIPPEKEGLIHMIGFILLVGLVIVITYFDIARVVSGSGVP